MRSVLLVACLLALTSSGARTEPIGAPVEISDRYHAGDRFMRVRLLGTVRLRNTPVAGFAASELSGIAWDEDERTLYAVSDAGHVVHLRPHFAGEVLTGTDLLATYPLRDEEGFVLREQFRDAEGLAIRHGDNDKPGDAELVVSFERRPRLAVYRADGTWIRSAPVPEVLHRRKHYAGDNSQLEAVTWTESVGIVVAPQKPLKSAPRNLHGLYDETGRVWTFPAIDPVDSSLVGLETAPDGSVLILERRYRNVFSPVVIALRRVRLDPARLPHGGAVMPEELARFDNTEGWMLDNFEGIARHRGNHYFLVSDDNNSAMQSTVLLYFEITD